MNLAPIHRDGTVSGLAGDIPDAAWSAIESTLQLYSTVGWVLPWIGYLAIERDECVGTCAFTHSPRDNIVEIAYNTFSGHEGRGAATRMAMSLMSIAYEHAPGIAITAHTLPEENASTRILRKTGFVFAGPRIDEEDGPIWVWRHQGAPAQPNPRNVAPLSSQPPKDSRRGLPRPSVQ
jgi:[ribosomal protein S5]-alanine N-acetyltransferase